MEHIIKEDIYNPYCPHGRLLGQISDQFTTTISHSIARVGSELSCVKCPSFMCKTNRGVICRHRVLSNKKYSWLNSFRKEVKLNDMNVDYIKNIITFLKRKNKNSFHDDEIEFLEKYLNKKINQEDDRMKFKRNLKVGDIVKIRSRKNMEKEFGLDENGDISCSSGHINSDGDNQSWLGQFIEITSIDYDGDFKYKGSSASYMPHEAVKFIVNDKESLKDLKVGDKVKLHKTKDVYDFYGIDREFYKKLYSNKIKTIERIDICRNTSKLSFTFLEGEDRYSVHCSAIKKVYPSEIKTKYERFLELDTMLLNDLVFEDNQYKEKNKKWFSDVLNRKGKIIYLDIEQTKDAKNIRDVWRNCIVLVIDGIPNAIPEPVFHKVLDVEGDFDNSEENKKRFLESEFGKQYCTPYLQSVTEEEYRDIFKEYYSMMKISNKID